MTPETSLTPEIAQEIVDFVQLSQVELTKAAQLAQQQTALTAAQQTLLPAIVDQLIARGFLQPVQKTAALQRLQDPVVALEILHEVAAGRDLHGRPAPDADRRGSPRALGASTTKTASVNNGGRSTRPDPRTDRLREFDVDALARLQAR